MKIARAMKKIAILKGSIADLGKRMQSCIATLSENDYDENFNELLETLKEKVGQLIDLKCQIMKANISSGNFRRVLEIGEKKSLLTQISGLEIKVGKCAADRWSDEKTATWKSQLTVAERNALKDTLQQEVMALSDQLDDFNAETDI